MIETKKLESIQHVGVAGIDDDFLLTPDQVLEMFDYPKTVETDFVMHTPHLPNIGVLKHALSRLMGVPMKEAAVKSVVYTGRFMYVFYNPFGISREFATGNFPSYQQTYTHPSTELPNKYTAACAPLPKGLPSTWKQADPFGGTTDWNAYPEYVPQYIAPIIEHSHGHRDPYIMLAAEDSPAADWFAIESYLFTQYWIQWRVGTKYVKYEQDGRVPASWFKDTMDAVKALAPPLIQMRPTFIETAYVVSTLYGEIAEGFNLEYL